MELKKLSEFLSVSGQVELHDLDAIASQGFKTLVNNRPDGEAIDQPARADLEAKATALGLAVYYMPLSAGQPPSPDLLVQFNAMLAQAPKPILAFCRTGNRSGQIYAAATAMPLSTAAQLHHQVVVVGGGTAGLSVTQSLLKRDPGLDIAVVEPSRTHDYQAAWTLVGAGEFQQEDTRRSTADVMPSKATWIEQAVASFVPEKNTVVLADGRALTYDALVVCPGLKLNWAGVEGLEAALGRGGVTSNYRYDLAPYTWELVQKFQGGNAVFTQPAMPIKCAGAPQKAMYLSCSHWEHNGILKNTRVQLFNAGAALFSVPEFVPPLMNYVTRYHAQLQFGHNLIRVESERKVAIFQAKNAQGVSTEVEQAYDLLHVVPPQCAPDFVAQSPLASASGWVDVDHHTLQHVKFANVFALGDASATPNAKTTAAVRKQAPIVAGNLIALLKRKPMVPQYDGYGACPLTVEKGKIILAEFGYGGKLLPTFPLDPLVPRKFNWFLKKHVFPRVYWDGALKGREWLAQCGPKDK